jgi:glyoxalase/bleomycin resistance protein/dioxygenase superfamily protein
MFALPNTQHSQVAYVTNDLDAAAALLEQQYGVPGFYKFDTTGVAQPGDPQLRIGLARVGGVEIELIEPQGSASNLFSDALPPSGAALSIRFHHVAIRIDGALENWQRHRAAIDTASHPIVYQGALGEMLRYFYTDERPTLGHYVEHVWMSPDLLAQLAAAIPTYPQGPQPQR